MCFLQLWVGSYLVPKGQRLLPGDTAGALLNGMLRCYRAPWSLSPGTKEARRVGVLLGRTLFIRRRWGCCCRAGGREEYGGHANDSPGFFQVQSCLILMVNEQVHQPYPEMDVVTRISHPRDAEPHLNTKESTRTSKGVV